MYKGMGFAWLILCHFPLISHENEKNLASLTPNYFIFIGYLKTGGGGGVQANPLWIRNCIVWSMSSSPSILYVCVGSKQIVTDQTAPI